MLPNIPSSVGLEISNRQDSESVLDQNSEALAASESTRNQSIQEEETEGETAPSTTSTEDRETIVRIRESNSETDEPFDDTTAIVQDDDDDDDDDDNDEDQEEEEIEEEPLQLPEQESNTSKTITAPTNKNEARSFNEYIRIAGEEMLRNDQKRLNELEEREMKAEIEHKHRPLEFVLAPKVWRERRKRKMDWLASENKAAERAREEKFAAILANGEEFFMTGKLSSVCNRAYPASPADDP